MKSLIRKAFSLAGGRAWARFAIGAGALFATMAGARSATTVVGAPLLLPDGQTRGRVMLTEAGAGRVRVDVRSYGGEDLLVGSGVHGVRIEAATECDDHVGPAYDPERRSRAPGALPNVTLDRYGSGGYAIVVRGIALRGSASVGGHAVVIYHGTEVDLCGTLGG